MGWFSQELRSPFQAVNDWLSSGVDQSTLAIRLGAVKPAHEFPEVAEVLGKRIEALEVEGIGAIGERARRMIVNFHEDSIDTRRHTCASQGFDELRLPSAALPLPTGELQGVSDVENNGIAK